MLSNSVRWRARLLVLISGAGAIGLLALAGTGAGAVAGAERTLPRGVPPITYATATAPATVSKKDALLLASGIAGFDSASATAECRLATDRVIPFIRIDERTVWVVSFKDVEIKVKRMDGTEWPANPYVRRIDVLLDAHTGQFLKAVSPEPERGVPQWPTGRAAEKEMRSRAWTFQPWLEVPKVKLSSALRGLTDWGQLVAGARQMVAMLVVLGAPDLAMKYGDTKPRPMWIITFRGIPPVRPVFGRASPDTLPHTHHSVVDPYTGDEVLARATNWP